MNSKDRNDKDLHGNENSKSRSRRSLRPARIDWCGLVGTLLTARLYASANPRIPAADLIRQSLPQASDLEVTDDLDTIVAIAAAGRYSGLVGGA